MANSEDVIVPADLEDDVAGSASALRVSPWCAPWLWSAVKVVLLVLLWHTFSTALSLNPLSPPAVPVHSRYALHYRIAMHLLPRARHPHLLLHVVGETEFELLGFILVMLASFMAGLRWVLLQVLLQCLCAVLALPHATILRFLTLPRIFAMVTPSSCHYLLPSPPSSPCLPPTLLTLLQYLAPVMALVCGIFSLLHEPWSSLASLPYFDTLSRNKARESEGHQVHALSDELLPHHPGAGPRTNSSCLLSRLKSRLKAIGCKSSLMSSSLTTRAGPPSNFSCCTTPPRSSRPPPSVSSLPRVSSLSPRHPRLQLILTCAAIHQHEFR
ncbi:unnamed protein product [Closterium sp. NIES-65]|nr:unnamed protein product [Closterium sp. NIES-65]